MARCVGHATYIYTQVLSVVALEQATESLNGENPVEFDAILFVHRNNVGVREIGSCHNYTLLVLFLRCNLSKSECLRSLGE